MVDYRYAGINHFLGSIMGNSLARALPRLGNGAPGVALLDAITVDSGPRKELSQFFLKADADARRIGVKLRFHQQFDDLLAVQLANKKSWIAFPPTFDPQKCDLLPETSFWISAQSSTGEVAATCAARFWLVGERGLEDEFTSLRFFFSHPEAPVARGVRCTVSGPALKACRQMVGRLSYTGAQWTHPDFRGRGIVHLLSKLNRALALTRWNTDYSAAVTRTDLAAKGVIGPYGYFSDRQISMFNIEQVDFDMSLIWTSRSRMEAEIADYARLKRRKAVRVTEADDTAMSPRDAHGSSRRS